MKWDVVWWNSVHEYVHNMSVSKPNLISAMTITEPWAQFLSFDMGAAGQRSNPSSVTNEWMNEWMNWNEMKWHEMKWNEMNEWMNEYISLRFVHKSRDLPNFSIWCRTRPQTIEVWVWGALFLTGRICRLCRSWWMLGYWFNVWQFWHGHIS